MKCNIKFLTLALGLMVFISCSKNIPMVTYQKLPKIRDLESFKNHYGDTVKLLGVLINSPLMNKKVVVEENAFFIKLSDGMLVLLPTKSDDEISINYLERLAGKDIFVVGQPYPPGFPPTYDGLGMCSFGTQLFVTAIDDDMLVQSQVSDMKALNARRERMEGEDYVFTRLVGTIPEVIPADQPFPLTITFLLEDKTPFEVTIEEKYDIDLLGYPGEKVFLKGQVNTQKDQAKIVEANITNYEKYMDYFTSK